MLPDQSRLDEKGSALDGKRLYDALNHELRVKITALKLKRAAEKLAEEEFHTGVISDDKGGFEYQLCIHKDYLYMRKKQGLSTMTTNTNSGSGSSSCKTPDALHRSSSYSNSQGGASTGNGGEERNGDWSEQPLQPSDIIL